MNRTSHSQQQNKSYYSQSDNTIELEQMLYNQLLKQTT